MGLLMSWNKSLKENNPKLSWTPQDVKSPDSLTPTACLTHFDFGSQPTDSMKKKKNREAFWVQVELQIQTMNKDVL